MYILPFQRECIHNTNTKQKRIRFSIGQMGKWKQYQISSLQSCWELLLYFSCSSWNNPPGMAVQSITLHSLHVIFAALTQIWRTAQELIEFLWDQLREEGIILVIKLWFQPCKAAFFPWCENKSCVHTENCKRGESNFKRSWPSRQFYGVEWVSK